LVQPVVGRTPTQPAYKQFLTHRKKHSHNRTAAMPCKEPNKRVSGFLSPTLPEGDPNGRHT
jgi:hypothetical protein